MMMAAEETRPSSSDVLGDQRRLAFTLLPRELSGNATDRDGRAIMDFTDLLPPKHVQTCLLRFKNVATRSLVGHAMSAGKDAFVGVFEPSAKLLCVARYLAASNYKTFERSVYELSPGNDNCGSMQRMVYLNAYEMRVEATYDNEEVLATISYLTPKHANYAQVVVPLSEPVFIDVTTCS